MRGLANTALNQSSESTSNRNSSRICNLSNLCSFLGSGGISRCLLDDLCRVACHNRVWCNILIRTSAYLTILRTDITTHLCHDTTRTHSATASNRHTRTNSDITTNPNILLNGDRLPRLWAICSISQVRIQRVGARVQAYIRSQQGSRADGNKTGCLLYTSPSPRDGLLSRMPSSA